LKFFRYINIFIILLFTSSCGGGGSGAVPTISFDYTTGTPSNSTNANSNLLLGSNSSLPYTDVNGNNYASLTAANNALNSGLYPIATQDTSASTAWNNGWTGSGVKVGVADDFNSNGQIDVHGDWVSLVINSVAPEATLGLENIYDLGNPCGASLSSTFNSVNNAYDVMETQGYHIVNNSWGIEKYYLDCGNNGVLIADSIWNNSVNSEVQATINSSATPYNSNMLFVYAAGNSAQNCGSSSLDDCNYFAAIFKGLKDAGLSNPTSRIIWVGSVTDGGTNIASYSLQAGDMGEDFIVAHDDVLTSGDAAGTSFAAPRVVGAAALLRHKFPNLNGSALKQVLLQTATDLGAKGVDNIYGYGLLNITNAMSPQGNVTPK
tara:strand:+ start:308 stop:1438 length:1131 start_codon:yes stop_codon:yes gene_type:complete